MSIARTSSVCRYQRSMPLPICRSYSSTTKDALDKRKPKSRQAQSTANVRTHPQKHGQEKKAKRYKMFVPQQASHSHISSSNRLYTTPEVWSFLQETGIEYDNSKAEGLDLGSDTQQIRALFGCQIQYGPLYILHPFDLQHLRPGGSSMLPVVMSKYRQKLEEEPLWVYTTSHGDHAIVKSLIAKRLSGAVWRAAKDLGFSMDGPKGTVMIKIFDVLRVSQAPAHILGEAVAKAVQRRWQQHLRQIAKKTGSPTASEKKTVGIF